MALSRVTRRHQAARRPDGSRRPDRARPARPSWPGSLRHDDQGTGPRPRGWRPSSAGRLAARTSAVPRAQLEAGQEAGTSRSTAPGRLERRGVPTFGSTAKPRRLAAPPPAPRPRRAARADPARGDEERGLPGACARRPRSSRTRPAASVLGQDALSTARAGPRGLDRASEPGSTKASVGDVRRRVAPRAGRGRARRVRGAPARRSRRGGRRRAASAAAAPRPCR